MGSTIYSKYYLPIAQAMTSQIERFPSAADLLIAESLQKRVPSCKAVPSQKDCTSCSDPYSYEDAEKIHVLPQQSPFIEVEFKGKRKALFSNEHNLSIRLGDYVVVEVDRGIDLGKVCAVGRIALRKLERIYNGNVPHFRILRVASQKDLEKYHANREDEKKALKICEGLIQQYKLTEMNLVDAEWQFDRKRITFYFTAPHQVDFRRLVRALAARFRARIELRQVSPREVAKRFGFVGICGKELCCTTFLPPSQHITIAAAESQQLPLNPTRLSGVCGRLKCCLLYELDLYVEALKEFPPLNAVVVLPEDRGQIIKIDIFKKMVTLYLEKAQTYQNFSLEEIQKLWKDGNILVDQQIVQMKTPSTFADLGDEDINPQELED